MLTWWSHRSPAHTSGLSWCPPSAPCSDTSPGMAKSFGDWGPATSSSASKSEDTELETTAESAGDGPERELGLGCPAPHPLCPLWGLCSWELRLLPVLRGAVGCQVPGRSSLNT